MYLIFRGTQISLSHAIKVNIKQSSLDLFPKYILVAFEWIYTVDWQLHLKYTYKIIKQGVTEI